MNNSLVKYRQNIFQRIGNFISKIFTKEKNISVNADSYTSSISVERQKDIDTIQKFEENFNKVYELHIDELMNLLDTYNKAIQALTIELVYFKMKNQK